MYLITTHSANNLQGENYLFDLSQGQIRALFYSYLNKAQLPKVKVHSLRHSFATTMVESGASILEVQQLLGHSDVITTKGYVHPNLVRNKNITIQENDEIFQQYQLYMPVSKSSLNMISKML